MANAVIIADLGQPLLGALIQQNTKSMDISITANDIRSTNRRHEDGIPNQSLTSQIIKMMKESKETNTQIQSKVLSIIVTHNPEIEKLRELMTQLQKKSYSAIIIDNNSKNILEIEETKGKFYLIKNESNHGLAAAQNLGIFFAKKKGFDYVFLLDQDSLFIGNTLYQLYSEMIQLREHFGNVAALGPLHAPDRKGEIFFPHISISKAGIPKKIIPKRNTKPAEVSSIISSGSLVPTEIFDKIGLMREDLFIDLIDTEWCLRATYKGYRIYSSTCAVLAHEIGQKTISFFGFCVPLHTPDRRYYKAKNSVILFSIKHIPKLLAIRILLSCAVHHTYFILNEGQKLEYLQQGTRGFLDGIKILLKD